MVREMVRLRTQASAPALSSVAELCAFVSGQLGSHADPAKAGPMAAYMKTDMPFYGVAKPEAGSDCHRDQRPFSHRRPRHL